MYMLSLGCSSKSRAGQYGSQGSDQYRPGFACHMALHIVSALFNCKLSELVLAFPLALIVQTMLLVSVALQISKLTI